MREAPDKKPLVLIVDDDESIRLLLKKQVERDGYAVALGIVKGMGSNDGQLDSSAHLRYRYFWDTWNIRAQTVELGYRARFGDRWLVEPHYRHYKQSAASFYANDFTTQMLMPSLRRVYTSRAWHIAISPSGA